MVEVQVVKDLNVNVIVGNIILTGPVRHKLKW